MSFIDAWYYIEARLYPDQAIDYWTNEEGYAEGRLTVRSVTPNAVMIDIPESKKPRRVPREDFERVYNIWAQYKEGQYTRESMVKEFTSYPDWIISILRWVEADNDENLP